MLCNAKLRGKDTLCQKHGMANGRCRLHGGLSPKGADHYNFQGKGCTKEERRKMVEENAKIKLLEMVAIELGLITKRR